jgi:hypothetical protein
MSLEPMFLLAVLVVSIIAGFGWSLGCWIFAKIVERRPA